MSLRSKISSAVDKAFAAAGDLVQTATLSNKTVQSYDFGSRSTTSNQSTSSVKVILLDKKNSQGTITTSAIMKSGVNLDVYDTLTIGNKVYRIVDSSDNDFAIEFTLVREEN